MAYERRMCSRRAVNWPASVYPQGGPDVAARVVDVSAHGARLLLPGVAPVDASTPVEVCFDRRSWRFGTPRVQSRRARVVFTRVSDDQLTLEAGVRFVTPLKRERPALLRWAAGCLAAWRPGVAAAL